MVAILINIFTVVLLFVAGFLGLVVLMQRAKTDGGMAAMGGGMAESAFGPDTGNVLSKATINAAIVFFVLSFLLYLGHVYERNQGARSTEGLPNISAPSTSTDSPQADSATSTGSGQASSPQADSAQPAAPQAPTTVPAASPSAATPTQNSPAPDKP